jgi:MFS family permease
MWKMLKTNADMRRVFMAQVISYLGDWFSFVAIIGLVDDLTGSKFLVSLVVVAFSLPSFLASPIAGSMADRFDRRRILVFVSVIQVVAAFGLLFVGKDTVWLAFLAQSTISALAAVISPATEASIPNIARDNDELAAANSLLGSTWGVMLAVGAAIGGVFASVFGRDAAFIANGVSFALAAILFSRIKTPMQKDRDVETQRQRIRPIADMREAINHSRKDPVLMALIFSKTTFAIGAGVVSQLAVLASDVFNGGDAARGLLIGVRGVGTGLGPLIAMRYTRGQLGKVLLICGFASLAFSGFYLVGAWMPTLWLTAIFVMLAHLGGGAQWTLSSYGLQLRSPDHIRGRILAGDFALVTLMLSLTSALAGLVSELYGVRQAISGFACAAAIASVIYIRATKRLRTQLLLQPNAEP